MMSAQISEREGEGEKGRETERERDRERERERERETHRQTCHYRDGDKVIHPLYDVVVGRVVYSYFAVT